MQSHFEDKCSECNSTDNNTNLTNEVTFPLSLEKSIETIVKKEGYISHDVVKRMIPTGGGSYLADLYEINVKGKTENGEKETNIFAKNIIPTENFKVISIKESYVRELLVYSEVVKVFEELQDYADVPSDKRFKTAKCYESNTETIMLENLAKKGFETWPRTDVISLKFAQLSIQQLAKFHGLSFVLQNRRPDYFNRKIKIMNQPYCLNEHLKGYFKSLINMSSEKLTPYSKKKIERFTSVFYDKFRKYMGDSSLAGACLCHGDFRANNVLMKLIDGQISEVVLIDFQLVYYGCPLNDFLYFIFTGTDQQFRREHLTDLKNMYYDTLTSFLNYFDIDVYEVYPRKEFERQYAEKLEFGLVLAMYLLPLCLAAEDDFPDMGKDDMSNMKFNLDSSFYARMQGIVDDFINWGYL